MQVGVAGGHASACRAHHVTLLYQVGLDDIHDRVGFFADRSGDRLQPDGAAVELLDDGLQDPSVHLVQTVLVDVQEGEGGLRHLFVDDTLGFHLGIIPDPLQESVDNSRRAA